MRDQRRSLVEPSLSACDARVGQPWLVFVLRRGHGLTALPIRQEPQLRMHREQVVEMARSGARKSHDHEGPIHRPIQRLWVASDRIFDEEAIRQQSHDLATRRRAPEQREIGLYFERVEQNPEALAEIIVSEVEEPGLATRFFE